MAHSPYSYEQIGVRQHGCTPNDQCLCTSLSGSPATCIAWGELFFCERLARAPLLEEREHDLESSISGPSDARAETSTKLTEAAIGNDTAIL